MGVKYVVDNFRYDDSYRDWTFLAANSSTFSNIRHTTKWGYLELRIKDSNNKEIYSYTPTGNNTEVTILIENTDVLGKLKVTRQRGLRE